MWVFRPLDPPHPLRFRDVSSADDHMIPPGQGGSGEGQAIEQGRDVGESEWIYPPIRKYRNEKPLVHGGCNGKIMNRLGIFD